MIAEFGDITEIRAEDVNRELDEVDPGYAVLASLCYQGISNALPWNVLLMAHNYFAKRLESLPAARNFIIYFTVIFMLIKVIFMVVGVSISAVKVRPYAQVTFSIFMNCLVFTGFTLICTLSILGTQAFYYVTLLLVLLASVFSAYAEAGFVSLLSSFPAKYTQSYMVGHALAGVISAIFSIASIKVAHTGSSQKFAGIFFGVSTGVIVLSFILMFAMRRMSLFRHFYRKCIVAAQNKHEAAKLESESGIPAVGHRSTWQIFLLIKDLFLTAVVLAWAGIIISPTLLFLTQSTDPSSQWGAEYFHVTILFLNSIFDLLGKTIPGIPIMRSSCIPILVLALVRLIFLPLFMMGNLVIPGYQLPFSPLLANDVFFVVLMSLKSMTGGYIMTLAMMTTPDRVGENDKAKAFALMVYGTAAGLLLGSFSALLFKHILIAISTPITG